MLRPNRAGRWTSRFGPASTLATLLASAPSAARADPAPDSIPVVFGADQVRLDANARAFEASGHVHVDQPPFHLTSDALTLRRVPIGAQLDGEGKVAFCPCLGTPLAVRFHRATVAPPHDLILQNPVLEVFGVPIAWAPAFWLRSSGRAGLLPWEVAWRGPDGLFLGAGVHLPWRDGDLARGLDVHAGAYLDGGVAVQGAMRTAASETAASWDRWRGEDGLGLELRGSTAEPGHDRSESLGWTVDVLRGARAVKATTDLDAAARPFDRADMQAAWRSGGWTFASGFRSVARRGSDLLDLGAGGPVLAMRRSDAIAGAGAYDATIEAGGVRSTGLASTSFARGEGGALVSTRLGVVGAALALRALGDVADDGSRAEVDGAVQGRASIALPMARDFGSPDEADPWVHETEPRLEAAAIANHVSDRPIVPLGRSAEASGGQAWMVAAGWHNAVGRWGSRGSVELDAYAGVVGSTRRSLPALRARAAAGGPWFGLQSELARVLAVPGLGGGGAWIARVRVGPASTFHLVAHVAERDGVDPVVARALIDAPLEPASGFLDAPGWTGGARVGVPLGSRMTARAGADVDLDAGELVAALGALELHDPCNCVVLRATAARRIGRSGVDAWLSVDLRPQ